MSADTKERTTQYLVIDKETGDFLVRTTDRSRALGYHDAYTVNTEGQSILAVVVADGEDILRDDLLTEISLED